MKRLFELLLMNVLCLAVAAQNKELTFHASDTALENAFNWAKQTALSYKGQPGDPVGLWYESALPPRSAFCMRDVAHQSIGAEILGLAKENQNMLTLFAKNISAGKNWCSYWEMNRWGKPAPEDYRNDTAFWYNLNANFDILNACWRLFLWTGDKTYIESPQFLNFHEKSVNEYISTWILQADSLLLRPAYPNAPQPFNEHDSFHRCRGLPSYSEGVPGLKMGIDLIAAIYRGLITYADILDITGRAKQAMVYRNKAGLYLKHIEEKWWDDKDQRYFTHITNDGIFGKGEGETFLLWFDVLKDSLRSQKTVQHLVTQNWNIENESYFPVVLSRYGYYDQAKRYVLHLSNPETKRREYPEVSFGVIEGVVQGLMGIDANAAKNRISTLFSGGEKDTLSVTYLPALSGSCSVWQDKKTTIMENQSAQTITWRVMFHGRHAFIRTANKKIKATYEQDRRGNTISFADIIIAPRKKITATVE